jgi:glycosyltransferase involved in cell wall biosynthesis
MIPVSVIIVTKNEAKNIANCLQSLKRFEDIWVVDSNSRDGTQAIAESSGARVISFDWKGVYPKKRQWCLDTLALRFDWVLFIDADELVTDRLSDEIERCISSNPEEAGFFVTGRYRCNQKILRFGVPNNKIALLNRRRMEFPVVDDLDIPGMGEIEGHYQPVLKSDCRNLKIGSLKNYLIHDALEDERAWAFRHEKYARWESGMNKKNTWPVDPIAWRENAKKFLRKSKSRPYIFFLYGFVLRLGLLDGRAGYEISRKRFHYIKKIQSL